MRTSMGRDTTATAQPDPPRIEWAWPTTLDRPEAERWVERRLPAAKNLRLALYHHPMAGAEFDWDEPAGSVRRSTTSSVRRAKRVSVLVDLVGGRAYATEPWRRHGLVRIEDALSQHGAEATDAAVSDPTPELPLAEARRRAQEIAHGIVLRQRRAASRRQLIMAGEPIAFGKPNWWVTGDHKGRPLEMILDAVTARHYMFSG